MCKVHSEKGDLVAFEVYSPKPVAIKSFFRAYIQNDINPWIKVFFSQKTINDCKEPALYKYIPEHNEHHQILPQEDAFFNYMVFEYGRGLMQRGLHISQYSLDRISEVPYIDEIAKTVGELYIIVAQQRTSDREVTYSKYLTWKEQGK